MVSSHARFEIYISIKYLSFKIYRLKLGLILATPALMDIIETSGPDSYNKVGGRIWVLFLKFCSTERFGPFRINMENYDFLPLPHQHCYDLVSI